MRSVGHIIPGFLVMIFIVTVCGSQPAQAFASTAVSVPTSSSTPSTVKPSSAVTSIPTSSGKAVPSTPSSGVLEPLPPSEPAIHIANGDNILVKGAQGILRCAITIAEPKMILTAGHCGESGAVVFADYKRIGTIERNYLTENINLDMSTIRLEENVQYTPSAIDLAYMPAVGDKITINSELSGKVDGTISSIDLETQSLTVPIGSFSANTWRAHLYGQRGDSGAPVYVKDKIIGLVQGGNNREVTTVTPLKNKPK